MHRILSLFACSLLVLSLVGCNAEAPQGPSSVDLNPDGQGELLPEVSEQRIEQRPRQRMDLDQLSRAITKVTGGQVWTEPNDDDNLFEELAATLGKPDYIENTSEDLTPSPLFLKFLGDAARVVCDRAVSAEQNGGEAVLMKHASPIDTVESNPEAIAQNMSYMLLRFHGHNHPPGSEQLNPWTWLHQSTTQITGDPALAWRSVCVALITHPDFYSY